MSWKEVTYMSQRIEFIHLAMQQGVNMSELCRRFQISRKTGYKFLNRFRQEGTMGIWDRSRKPKTSPNRTDKGMEEMILTLRNQQPNWGGRKLKRRLEDLGYRSLPSPSTITAILKRNGQIAPEESRKRKAYQRFCAERPNDLWQMDHKGYFQTRDGSCYPLTILDDHSRFSLCIAACRNKRKETVQAHLTQTFRTYGLPWRILVDNGSPWGDDLDSRYTKLTVWMIRLGIQVIHSRPYHPQTLGKEERFHRTMEADLAPQCGSKFFSQCQEIFNDWKKMYNTERPHEALNQDVPSRHYQMSSRRFPERLPEITYNDSDQVRKVQHGGRISFRNKEYKLGKAFVGQPVAIRPTCRMNIFDVYFMSHQIAQIHLK